MRFMKLNSTSNTPSGSVAAAAVRLVLVLSIVMLLFGCTRTFREDYLSMNRGFIDYSLGKDNWEITDAGTRTEEFADGSVNYRWWELGYTDAQGKQQSFYFDDCHYSTDDDVYFADALALAAAAGAGERLSEALPANYQGSDTTAPLLTVNVVQSQYRSADKQATMVYTQRILSVDGGMRLYDPEPALVFLDHRAYLEISASFTDEAAYRDAMHSLYQDVRDYLGFDVDMTLELYLYKKDGVPPAGALPEVESSKGALLESWQGAWTNGTELLPELKEGQSLRAWFAEMQKQRYFS
ncbi:hypothetical protein FACS1894104_1410 [Actinomycetota bacterium]|nr:hypothetical protein FACS1894104_1410 [Actinomycetota bacterium]